MSGLMIFLPADRAWSLDAWRKLEIRVDAVPAWTLNILRFQVTVVYIFAGLGKFSSDWLLQAEPLRVWFAARSDLPLIGPWLNEAWVAYAASWFGAFFDSGIVFFLLCKSTRRMAYVLVIVFHVATWVLFHIGMFPWIMIVAATLIFPADWRRHWLSRLSLAVSHAVKWVSLARQLNAAVAIKHPPRVLAGRMSRVLLTTLGANAAV